MEEVSQENEIRLENTYRTTRTIIAGMIVFTILLTVSIWFFAPIPTKSISQQTLTTLWVLIIFLAVGAFLLRRAFFRWDKLKDIFLLKGIVGLLKNLQRDAIILAVFATLLPVVGGIITFLTGATFEIVRAEIVAIIVFLINFPRQTVWRKIIGGLEKL